MCTQHETNREAGGGATHSYDFLQARVAGGKLTEAGLAKLSSHDLGKKDSDSDGQEGDELGGEVGAMPAKLALGMSEGAGSAIHELPGKQEVVASASAVTVKVVANRQKRAVALENVQAEDLMSSGLPDNPGSPVLGGDQGLLQLLTSGPRTDVDAGGGELGRDAGKLIHVGAVGDGVELLRVVSYK